MNDCFRYLPIGLPDDIGRNITDDHKTQGGFILHFEEILHKHKEELIRCLRECIRIPSVYQEDESAYPYGEDIHRCLLYMLKTAGELGFTTGNLDNHVGWCEYGTGEEMVAVLGHLDVVPEGDGWSVPPYEGRVEGNRLYGRGAMDDKGPTVAALYALLALKESGLPVNRRIRLIFGLNEETGSADMKYYKEHGGEIPLMGFTPDGEYPVINGEKGLINEQFTCALNQTGELRIKKLWGGTAHNIVPDEAYAELVCPKELAIGIAGHLMNAGDSRRESAVICTLTEDGVRLDACGVGAHGGTPEEGVNANGMLMKTLAKLPLEGQAAQVVQFLAEKLGMEYDGASLGIGVSDEVSGKLTMNWGVLRGDENHVEVKLNYRYPVTKTYECCGPVVKAAFEEAGFVQTALSHKNALYMPPDSPLVQKLMKVYTDYTGHNTSPKSIGGGTYAKMLPNVVAFGPIFLGDEVREHKPDEYIEISRLMDNAIIIAEAMYALAVDAL